MNKLCPEALPVAISTLAAAISKQLSQEELELAAAAFEQLAESLELIAAARGSSNCGTSGSAIVQFGEGG
ncbi:MAG: hypothetical protein HDT25_01810, partial [Ruminococcus sp.]|nr:hypothetical protein [Ruminococcus sp.]